MFDLLSNLSFGSQGSGDAKALSSGSGSPNKAIGQPSQDFSLLLNNLLAESGQENVAGSPGDGLQNQASELGLLIQSLLNQGESPNQVAPGFASNMQKYGFLPQFETPNLATAPLPTESISTESVVVSEVPFQSIGDGESPLGAAPFGLNSKAYPGEMGALSTAQPSIPGQPGNIIPEPTMAGRAPAPQVAIPSGEQSELAIQDRRSQLMGQRVELPTPGGIESRSGGQPKMAPVSGSDFEKSSTSPLEMQLAAQVPAIALMTGHLEHLSPQQIPDLVATNKFIQGALQEGDINAFMEKPQPVSQILLGLNLPNEIMAQIDLNKVGLTKDQLISPKQLLNLMGIDYQRVTVELGQLKDNLATEGLSPYLVRAAALRGNRGKVAAPKLDDKDNPLGLAAPLTSPNPTGAPQLADRIADTSDKSAAAKANPNKGMTEVPVPSFDATAIGANPRPNLGSSTGMVGMGQLPDAQLGSSPILASELNGLSGMSGASIAEFSKELAPPTVALGRGEGLRTDLFQSAAPVNEMSFDHFHDLTQAIRRDQNAVQMKMANTFGGTANANPNLEGLGLIMPSPISAKDRGTGTAMETLDLHGLMERGESNLSHNPQVLGEFGGSSSGSKDEQSSKDRSNLSDNIMDHLMAGRIQHSAKENRFEVAKDVAARTSQPEPPQNLQQIIDRISDRTFMAVREGGGLVRLDFKHDSLGHLDLAMDVQKGKVDLRILAGSETAKELLTGELPNLRDALGAQQITLGDVEIGVREAGRAQGNTGQFAGQFGQDSGQAAQDFASRSETLNNFDRLRTRSEPLVQMAATAARRMPANHGGRIQVMA